MNLSLRRIHYRKQSSSALIIVLFAVVLVTLMILALMTGARLERQSAFYYEERIRADALAQSGLDQAIGLLRTGMGSITNQWVSGPGLMVSTTYNAGNNALSIGSPIQLSSGTNMVTPTGVWQAANLNSQMLDGTYPLDGGGSAMSVRWIYVRQDGTLDNSDTPATNTANPLVGRYAFWVDDSSSRLNLNTAFQRANNANAPSDVSRIDLTTIPAFATVAADTHAYATNNPFNSDYDLRANKIESAVTNNCYAYTFYNHSSDGPNPFGQPKIYLTTQSAYLPPGFTNMPGYKNYYFDILANDNGTFMDPGRVANLSDANISTTVNNLYSYLTNSAWPEIAGTSFASKFWHSTIAAPDPRIYQMAVNIIEYVRAKESTNIIVEPIRGYVNGSPGTFISTTVSADTVPRGSDGNKFDSTQAMPIMGVTRTPQITEVGVFWDKASDGSSYLDAHAEVYLPPNVGIDTLSTAQIVFGFRIGISGSSDGWVNFANDVGYAGISNAGGMNQGSWYTVVPPAGGPVFPLNATNRFVRVGGGVQWPFGLTAPTAAAPLQTYVWTCLMPANDLEVVSTAAPLDMGGAWGTGGVNTGEMIGPITLTTNSVNPYNISYSNSYQVNDPLMGAISTNWVSMPSTWGAANTAVITLGKRPTASTTVPYPDVDSNGFVTNIGWRMPYPYLYAQTNLLGATTNVPNQTGRMDSLAELGYVNTGAVDWSGPTANSDQNGVAYRTLHLQPMRSGTHMLPDWALLDLFALPPPATSTSFTYQPYAWTNIANTYNGVGGRLNLNGLIYPFTNGTTRIAPLDALLSGATNPTTGGTLSATMAGLLATNILYQSNSIGVALGTISITGQAFDSTNGLYAHVGQLAEVAGIADGGEASEANLYEPLAQTTVSGNVFTIYTVGQALRQLPSGAVVVNGEKRYQATVERIPTVPASQISGLFRNVVVRELTP